MSPITVLAETLSTNLRELDTLLKASHGSSPHLWEPRPYEGLDDPTQPPELDAFNLIDKIRTDLKAVEALITPSHFKLVELGLVQYKVAALNTAVSLNVADALVELGGHASLGDLASKVGTNEHKLGERSQVHYPSCFNTEIRPGKIMRVLTGEHIFQEVSKNTFSHSRHSMTLAGSPGARSFMSFMFARSRYQYWL
jgi:hypothetical protein